MIKYFGFALILASAFILSREYEKNQRKRLAELAEFLRLFEHIKTKISCFLSPKSDWLSDFSSTLTGISEFIVSARSSSLAESFEKSVDKLSLGDEREYVKSILSSLGRAYKNDEVALLEDGISRLSAEKERLSLECEKNIKTARVLAAALGLGLVILLA